MNQSVQTTSQNSQNQLSKQVNTLIQFAKTNDEVQIINAIEKSVQIGKLDNWNELLKVVAKWRMYIGIPKQDISEELNIVTQYISATYPFLTLAEIELAYNMAISKKLDDVEFFGYFSPLYVSKVLESYLYYRKINMADSLRRKQKYEQEQEELKNRPTPEEQAVTTREIMLEFYKKYKETGVVDDLLNICYNFLRKHKMLKVTQVEIDEALKYANGKIIDKPLPFSKIFNDTKDYEIKIIARNYIVQNFFENVDIDILLNNIKSEQFD